MIRIEFQNTLDDLREANGMAAAKRKGWLGRVIAWGALLIPLALIVFIFRETRLGDTASTPFPWGRLALVLAPSLVFFGVFTWAILRATWKVPEPWNPPPTAKTSRAPTLRGIGGWVMFFVLAVYFFYVFSRPGAPAPAGPGVLPPALSTGPERLPSYFEHLLPLLGWALVVVSIVLFTRASRRMLPRTWAAIRHEHEPRVLHASADGIVIEQASARLEYRWGYFAGYRETDNLVLLYLSPYQFFMIPKRAFAEPGQLAVFKGLVMNGIANGYFLPADSTSFPVLPPPIPVLPIAEEPASDETGDEAR